MVEENIKKFDEEQLRRTFIVETRRKKAVRDGTHLEEFNRTQDEKFKRFHDLREAYNVR